MKPDGPLHYPVGATNQPHSRSIVCCEVVTRHAAAAYLYETGWVIIHQVGKSKAQLCGARFCMDYGVEEVHFRSLNFCKSLFFIPELQNRIKYIPQFLKPCILCP